MKYLLCLWLGITGLTLSGQQDSLPLSTTVDEIVIQDTRLSSIPLTVRPAQSFSEQLANQSSVYVRSYGKGSLATLSLRGGTSSQTQLQWDGLPIHNPMLGLADLSLVSSPLFSKAILHSGGQSTFHGSGAICGVLEIKQDKHADGTHLSFSQGSFGTRSYSLGHNASWGRFSFSAKGSWEVADNDFVHIVGGTERVQTNAAVSYTHLTLPTIYSV